VLTAHHTSPTVPPPTGERRKAKGQTPARETSRRGHFFVPCRGCLLYSKISRCFSTSDGSDRPSPRGRVEERFARANLHPPGGAPFRRRRARQPDPRPLCEAHIYLSTAAQRTGCDGSGAARGWRRRRGFGSRRQEGRVCGSSSADRPRPTPWGDACSAAEKNASAEGGGRDPLSHQALARSQGGRPRDRRGTRCRRELEGPIHHAACFSTCQFTVSTFGRIL
jgi:hypothetical protein